MPKKNPIINRTEVLLPQAHKKTLEQEANLPIDEYISNRFEKFYDSHSLAIVGGSFYSKMGDTARREGSLDAAISTTLFADHVKTGFVFAMADGYSHTKEDSENLSTARVAYKACEIFVDKAAEENSISSDNMRSFLHLNEPKSASVALKNINQKYQSTSSLIAGKIESWKDAEGKNISHGIFSNTGNGMILIIDPVSKTLKHCVSAREYYFNNVYSPQSIQGINEHNQNNIQVQKFDLQPDWIVLSITDGVFPGFKYKMQEWGRTWKNQHVPFDSSTNTNKLEPDAVVQPEYKEILPEVESFNKLVAEILKSEMPHTLTPSAHIADQLLMQVGEAIQTEKKEFLALKQLLQPYIAAYKKENLTIAKYSIQEWLKDIAEQYSTEMSTFNMAVTELQKSVGKSTANQDILFKEFIDLLENRNKHLEESQKRINFPNNNNLNHGGMKRENLNNQKISLSLLDDDENPLDPKDPGPINFMNRLHTFQNNYEMIKKYFNQQDYQNTELTLGAWMSMVPLKTKRIYDHIEKSIPCRYDDPVIKLINEIEQKTFGDDATITVMRVPDPDVELIRALMMYPDQSESFLPKISKIDPTKFEMIFARLREEGHFVRVEKPVKLEDSTYSNDFDRGIRQRELQNKYAKSYSQVELDHAMKKGFSASLNAYVKTQLSNKNFDDAVALLGNIFKNSKSEEDHDSNLRFINIHKRPRIDRFFGIHQTKTWAESWGDIRKKALENLLEEVNRLSNTESQKALLEKALKNEFLFTKHRTNFKYLTFAGFRKTSAEKAIQQKLNSIKL